MRQKFKCPSCGGDIGLMFRESVTPRCENCGNRYLIRLPKDDLSYEIIDASNNNMPVRLDKYKVGDEFIDRKDGSIIKIQNVDPVQGYDIACDGEKFDYGVTNAYLDANCDKIT